MTSQLKSVFHPFQKQPSSQNGFTFPQNCYLRYTIRNMGVAWQGLQESLSPGNTSQDQHSSSNTNNLEATKWCSFVRNRQPRQVHESLIPLQNPHDTTSQQLMKLWKCSLTLTTWLKTQCISCYFHCKTDDWFHCCIPSFLAPKISLLGNARHY